MPSPADAAPPDTGPVPSEGMSRRAAIGFGGGALALVLGGAVGWRVWQDDDSSPARPPTVDSLVPAPDTVPVFDDAGPGVIAVGTRYVQTHPDDADLDTLLAELAPVDGDPVAAAASVVRDEFRRGVTVVVDGWVLARSEARAAAIIALSCAGDRC